MRWLLCDYADLDVPCVCLFHNYVLQIQTPGYLRMRVGAPWRGLDLLPSPPPASQVPYRKEFIRNRTEPAEPNLEPAGTGRGNEPNRLELLLKFLGALPTHEVRILTETKLPGNMHEVWVPKRKLLAGPIATLLKRGTSIFPLGTLMHITRKCCLNEIR